MAKTEAVQLRMVSLIVCICNCAFAHRAVAVGAYWFQRGGGCLRTFENAIVFEKIGSEEALANF